MYVIYKELLDINVQGVGKYCVFEVFVRWTAKCENLQHFKTNTISKEQPVCWYKPRKRSVSCMKTFRSIRYSLL